MQNPRRVSFVSCKFCGFDSPIEYGGLDADGCCPECRMVGRPRLTLAPDLTVRHTSL